MDPDRVLEEGCQCKTSGECPHLGIRMSDGDHRICRNAPRHVRRRLLIAKGAIDDDLRSPSYLETINTCGVTPKDKWRTCIYLGPAIRENGAAQTTDCVPCGAKTRLKVFECRHTEVGKTDPDSCKRCTFWARRPDPSTMTIAPLNEKTTKVTGMIPWRIAHFTGWQSLGILSFKIAMELEKLGLDVRLAPIHGDNRFLDVGEWVKAHTDQAAVDAASWCVQSSGPHAPIPTHQQVIKLTCQDSDGLQPRQRIGLNSCIGIMGFSHFNADCWRKLAVGARIGVCPLGVDTAAFRHMDDPPTDPFTFGSAGRLQHGPKRKNIQFVYDVFVSLADQMPDARLKLRITPGDKIRLASHPQVELLQSVTTQQEVAEWYRSLSVYVAAARCESWGMMPHEAMACGRPVIMNPWGGSMDFWTPECGWPLEYVLEPRDDPCDSDTGNWASPTAESLSAAMLHVYNNREELPRKGLAAAARAAEFTWDKSAIAFRDFLVECGMLERSSS